MLNDRHIQYSEGVKDSETCVSDIANAIRRSDVEAYPQRNAFYSVGFRHDAHSSGYFVRRSSDFGDDKPAQQRAQPGS